MTELEKHNKNEQETRKYVHIIGGGTVSHVRSHLALCAPAYGNTARILSELCKIQSDKLAIEVHLTKMAGGKLLENNKDISLLLDNLIEDSTTKIVFMSAALVDYEGQVGVIESGKYARRLSSRENPTLTMYLNAADKLLSKIRKTRKDIFLVGFKTTSGKTEDEQYIAGLNLLKEASCNLVLANDTATRTNIIITENNELVYSTKIRDLALQKLVQLTFNQDYSTDVDDINTTPVETKRWLTTKDYTL